MKKIILRFILFSFLLLSLHAQIPSQLQGLWEGKDRYIFFDSEEDICFILKEYYSWYLDRVVEPESYSTVLERKRNLATQKNPINFTCNFFEYKELQNAWEIEILQNQKEILKTPIALHGDNLYLNFLIKVLTDETEQSNSITGYWQGINYSNDIRISGRRNIPNIYSWFITDDGIYKLRFWETDMKLNNEAIAEFTDGEKLFQVNKHIYSAGQVYTCATGRSSRIRNVEKSYSFLNDYTTNEESTLMFLGKPYLTRVKEITTIESLMKLVQEQNSKKKPAPEPIFPVHLPKFPGE